MAVLLIYFFFPGLYISSIYKVSSITLIHLESIVAKGLLSVRSPSPAVIPSSICCVAVVVIASSFFRVSASVPFFGLVGLEGLFSTGLSLILL